MALYLNFFKDEIDELRRRAFEERGVEVLPAPWKKKKRLVNSGAAALQFGQSRTLSAKHFFPHHPGVTKNCENMCGINIPERILPLVVSIDFILYIVWSNYITPRIWVHLLEKYPVDSSSVENNITVWYKVDYTYIWHLECYTNFVKKTEIILPH